MNKYNDESHSNRLSHSQRRRQLAAPFGFKISQTLFTSDFSNANADKAGFQLDVAISFDELNAINPDFHFDNMSSRGVAIKTLIL